MPIRPENRDRYPKNWKDIRKKILERAGHKCEKCGVPNGAYGHRRPDGSFCNYDEPGSLPEDVDLPGAFKIVLTIAHLDHVPENCSEENLRAWCQRCHNRYDAPMRAAGRKARARLT